MTDLVKRLRDRYSKHSQELRDEAAERIERMTADRDKYKEEAHLLTDERDSLQARVDELEKINYNLTRDNIEQANKLFGAEQRVKALEGERK